MIAQFVLFDGFDPLDVIAPFEVFSAARAFTAQVNAELASAEGPREVRSGIPGLALAATARVDPGADLIVVPGAAGRPLPQGAGISDEERETTIPAILGRAAHSGLSGLLAQAMATPGTTVATVCGGSLILAMAGSSTAATPPLITRAWTSLARAAPMLSGSASSMTATWSAPAASPPAWT